MSNEINYIDIEIEFQLSHPNYRNGSVRLIRNVLMLFIFR